MTTDTIITARGLTKTFTVKKEKVTAVSDLDLSYTPPLGSPWDATQLAAQAWVRQYHLDIQRRVLATDVGPRSA